MQADTSDIPRGRRHGRKPLRLSSFEFQKFFIRVANPVLRSENTLRTREYKQHGCISCYDHSLAVAFYSLKIANRFRMRCNRESLVKGALLHDFFLYDWHVADRSHGLHGFTHSRTALHNAAMEFNLDKIEKDIILSHMFPLNLKPPRCKESWIVWLVDKFCSLAETFGLAAYPAVAGLYETEAL